MVRQSVGGFMLQLLLVIVAMHRVLAYCPVPVQFRVAAFDTWLAYIQDASGTYVATFAGPFIKTDMKYDKIAGNFSDRLENVTMWLQPGVYTLLFRVSYQQTSGIMASVFYGDVLLTQTGQPGWSGLLDSGASINISACAVAPASINAYGQSYMDFVSMGNQSAPQPQWIAQDGTCVNASNPNKSPNATTAFWTMVGFSVPNTSYAICPNRGGYYTSVQPWSKLIESPIGAQNGSKSLRLRISSQNFIYISLANYTVEDSYNWASLSDSQARAHVMDYKLTVESSSPIVLGIESRNYYTYNDGYGIIATLLYDNAVVTTTGGTSGWKVTNNSQLVRHGWNWNYTYDTSGWLAVDPTPCTMQQDYGFVQPFVSDLGACSKFIGYPDCKPASSGPVLYYRYAFDPATFVQLPNSVCKSSGLAPCPAGTYPSANTQACNICPLNTFKYLAGNGSCSACPATMSTNTTGSSTCSCASGYGWNGSMCTACPVNSFKPDFSNTTCTYCATPAYATCNATSFTCAAGYTVTGDGLSCVACPTGTYKSAAGGDNCLPCGGNLSTYSSASTSANSCMCALGYGIAGSGCTACAANTYKAVVSNATCLSCPLNSASCSSTGFTCNAGFSMSPDGLQCTQCTAGMYKSAAGNGTCTACPSGATTQSNGATNILECVCSAGSAGNNGTVCTACAIGSYKDTTGNTNCTACPAGFTTVGNGSVAAGSCVCQPGYEWDGFTCVQCGGNRFKLDAGNGACQPCSANAVCTPTSIICTAGYTRGPGGTLCIQCASGTLKSTAGNGPCDPCPPGSTDPQCTFVQPENGATNDTSTGDSNVQAPAGIVISGISLPVMYIAIVGGVVLLAAVATAIAVHACCKRRRTAAKELSIPLATKSPSSIHDDFSSTSMIRTNNYSTGTYGGNVTTLMVDNTEFAIPGFLQFQAGRDFRWETPVAKGGGGEVFVGRGFAYNLLKDNGDGSLIVKVVAPSRSAISLKASQAFDQEIAVMHYLGRHRNISQMLGWCEEPLALLMKYYKLGDLRTFVIGNFLQTKGQVCIFAKDICGALQFMHDKGVAHRDIKAENVFIDVDSDGGAVCVLGDFGIANIFSRNADLVEGFNVINLNGLTVAYSAPEVIQRFRQRNNRIDKDAAFHGDIYSTSILLYFLLNRVEAWSV